MRWSTKWRRLSNDRSSCAPQVRLALRELQAEGRVFGQRAMYGLTRRLQPQIETITVAVPEVFNAPCASLRTVCEALLTSLLVAGRPLHGAVATKSPSLARREPSPERELRLLREAHESLAEQPARALALARRHLRENPHGAFAQEREMLTLAALLRLEHHDLALECARRFLSEYPDSPHARALQHLVERWAELAILDTPPRSC